MHSILTMKLRRAERMTRERVRAGHVLRNVELVSDASGPRLAPVVLCDRDLPGHWLPQVRTILTGVIR